jgi:hypothetical protein
MQKLTGGQSDNKIYSSCATALVPCLFDLLKTTKYINGTGLMLDDIKIDI